MRHTIITCLLAWMALGELQAQTIELPTKKKKNEANKETVLPQQGEAETNKPATAPTGQEGPLTLPTTKRQEGTDAPTAAPQHNDSIGQSLVRPLPVVKRQEAPRAKPIIPKPKVEDNSIYESAEKMPTYPGGAAELQKFITEHLVYPEEALADSAQGLVQVSFIVEKNGSPTDFEVLDKHHPALEAEAVRILQQMPKWKPASQNGVKVRVEYVVPVKFTLPKP